MILKRRHRTGEIADRDARGITRTATAVNDLRRLPRRRLTSLFPINPFVRLTCFNFIRFNTIGQIVSISMLCNDCRADMI
jgi:hypothetical protein